MATAMSVPLSSAKVTARGSLDFRGTLGVDRAAPVGFTSIALTFELDSSANREQLEKLIQLTERYCVVLQTLKQSASISSELDLSRDQSTRSAQHSIES